MASTRDRIGRLLAVGCLSALAWAGAARGHESLYHYLEVRLPRAAPAPVESGAAGIRGGGHLGGTPAVLSFSIHAAELQGAQEAGADPDSVDLAWLAGMEDAAYERILDEARRFVARSFRLRRAEAPPRAPAVGEAESDRCVGIGTRLEFPSRKSLSSDALGAEGAEGARPGFLAATLEVELAALAEMRLDYSPEAEKRLLLVVTRPGDFPKVRDLAPGDSAAVSPRTGEILHSPGGLHGAALGKESASWIPLPAAAPVDPPP